MSAVLTFTHAFTATKSDILISYEDLEYRVPKSDKEAFGKVTALLAGGIARDFKAKMKEEKEGSFPYAGHGHLDHPREMYFDSDVEEAEQQPVPYAVKLDTSCDEEADHARKRRRHMFKRLVATVGAINDELPDFVETLRFLN